jgi:hypothetical protein
MQTLTDIEDRIKMECTSLIAGKDPKKLVTDLKKGNITIFNLDKPKRVAKLGKLLRKGFKCDFSLMTSEMKTQLTSNYRIANKDPSLIEDQKEDARYAFTQFNNRKYN